MSEVQRAGTGPSGGNLREGRYWGISRSGEHQVSRPIVVDGLREAQVTIELAPRIRWTGTGWVDDSYHAVDQATLQFARHLTLEQLAMATVVLRIQMRRAKEQLEKKKVLQEEWTALARRMKRHRVEQDHLRFAEESLNERRAELDALREPAETLHQLLAEQRAELADRRALLDADEAVLKDAWKELERRDAEVVGESPHPEKVQDLKTPFVLTLLGGRPDPPARVRSLGSAMNVLVEALQTPLSRTDQMLLEIAMRRCVRAAAPSDSRNPEVWEREILRRAEAEFVAEFAWARPYALGAGGPPPPMGAAR